MYLLAVPGIAFMGLFSYGPMYGLQLAFKKLNYGAGIWGSPWVGLANFKEFFVTDSALRSIRNTVILNLYDLVFGFTFVIFLALMLNEMRIGWLKKVTQTFVYLPHFISWVVFAGIITTFLSVDRGFINSVIVFFGGSPIDFIRQPQYFRAIVVIASIIKTSGYSTIIYLAAIAGVNVELYESARVDGANRYHMIRYITLPRIYPTIAVLLIMQLAGLFSSNFDMIYNLYSSQVFETGDVIATYIYRIALNPGNSVAKYEVATAMSLMFNAASFLTIIAANRVVKKLDVMGIF